MKKLIRLISLNNPHDWNLIDSILSQTIATFDDREFTEVHNAIGHSVHWLPYYRDWC